MPEVSPAIIPLTPNPPFMPTLSPTYDNKIYQKYSKKMLENKEKNKILFCQDFSLNYNKKTPLFCITFPLTEKNNLGLLQDVIHGLLEQNIVLVIIGVGTQKYQDFFTQLTREYSKRVAIANDNDENKRKIYAASDILLATCTTDECKEEIEKALNYGVIPICPENEVAKDYNGAKEEGNAFIYKEKSPWSFFASIIRALENFKFPYDWRTIQANAMGREDEAEEEEE